MEHKKRNIIIISSVSAAVVIGIVFLVLGFTIWRPKTTQEWLNDFTNGDGGVLQQLTRISAKRLQNPSVPICCKLK